MKTEEEKAEEKVKELEEHARKVGQAQTWAAAVYTTLTEAGLMSKTGEKGAKGEELSVPTDPGTGEQVEGVFMVLAEPMLVKIAHRLVQDYTTRAVQRSMAPKPKHVRAH